MMTTQPETPADLDALLSNLLEDDLLAIMLTPPRVPSFCRETVCPGAGS